MKSGGKMSKKKITAGDIQDAIAKAHPAPGWATFLEVANKTGGYGTRRYADAVAMSLWPSRGLVIRGFEVKVAKSDFKKELSDPEKAEAIAQYCDEWWLATPEGLVADVALEVPEAWGLMVLGEEGLKTVKKAKVLTPAPLTRGFIASLLRRAHEMATRDESEWIRRSEIQEQLDAAEELGKSMVPREIKRIEAERVRLQELIESFRNETGLDLDGDWRSPGVSMIGQCYRLGKALLGEYRYASRYKGFMNLLKEAEKAIVGIKADLAEVNKLYEGTVKPEEEDDDGL